MRDDSLASREAGAGEVETKAPQWDSPTAREAWWLANTTDHGAMAQVDALERLFRAGNVFLGTDLRASVLDSLAVIRAALRPPAGVRETAAFPMDAEALNLTCERAWTAVGDLNRYRRAFTGTITRNLASAIASMENLIAIVRVVQTKLESPSALPPAGRREAEDTTLRDAVIATAVEFEKFLDGRAERALCEAVRALRKAAPVAADARERDTDA